MAPTVAARYIRAPLTDGGITMMGFTTRSFFGLVLALAGCTAPEPSLCADATRHLTACGITDDELPSATSCDERSARTVLESSCDDLASSERAGKADGSFDAVLCKIGFSAHCPVAAPVRDDETGWFDRYNLPGDSLHPEGAAFDPVDEAFYVGSLDDGSVSRIDARTADVDIVSPADSDEWRTLGMAVDADNRRLVVCAIHDVEPLSGEIWEFDLTNGVRTRHDLRDAADGASCNDVALSDDGIAFVTDREKPNVYRVDLDRGEVTLFVTDELLEKPSVGIGQNGIVVLPNRAGIVTTTYLPPRLNYISMDDEPLVRRVDVDGDFHDYTSLGSGADGMVLFEGSLYVMFATELVRVDSDDEWRTAATHATRVSPGMTDVVVAGDDLYMLNGQAVRFISKRDPRLPFALVRFDP